MELSARGGNFPVGSGAVGYENGMKHQFSSVESWAQVCEETQRCMLESAWKEAARIVKLRREKDQLDDLETVQKKDTVSRKVIAVLHVCDSVRNGMIGHDRSLDAYPLKPNGVIDKLKVELRYPESILHDSWKISRKVAEEQQHSAYEFGMSFALETTTLFSGHGTDVHFSVDESVMLLGLVTSRIVAAIQLCGILYMSLTRDRVCNCSPLVSCKDSAAFLSFVKRSLSERFGKTVGVTKLNDVFQWTSSDSLKDNEEALHVLKDACEKVHLEYSNTRLETVASTKRLLDTGADYIRDDAESEMDMTIRWGMVDDCYAM